MKYAPYRREEPLSRLKKTSFPKEWLFIDTETKPMPITKTMRYNVFYLGVMIYVRLDKKANIIDREIIRFNRVTDVLLYLAEKLTKKKRIMVVGHNIAFDIEVMNLPKIFHELGCISTYPIRNGMTFIWRVQTGTGSLTFIDTANYATTSLKQIGKDLGHEKMEINFETCTDEELYIYCENDVYITQLFIMEYILFLLHENMGEFKTTIASQALTAYRHRFMSLSPVFHNNDAVNEIEKYSYFGGRTECFYIGKIPENVIYNLDVSSEYPAAMIASKLPYQMVNYNQHVIPALFDHHLKHNYMIVNCLIETSIPVYPMRAKITGRKDEIELQVISDYQTGLNNHKVIFPVGEFKTWLHQAEFIYALEHNHIKKIYGYVVYKSTDLFSDYVNTLYEYKKKYSQEGKSGFRYVTKILLNSLYGKWGQEYHDTQFIGNVPLNTDMITYGFNGKYGYNYTDINWFGKLYRTYQTGLSTYSFPAIAGAITSNARMILWQYIEKAGQENVYYTDTDSLFVNHIGYTHLKDYIKPDTLGSLEDKSHTDNCIIFGCKDYVFGADTVHKGIGKNAILDKDGKWHFDHFEGFNSWRNNGANLPPVTEEISKTRADYYDKGIMQEDASILPFVLSMHSNVLTIPLPHLRKLYLISLSELIR